MDWLTPTYGLAAIALPIVVWLYWRLAEWRRASQERFGDATVVTRLSTFLRPYRRRMKVSLVVIALLLLVISLMGPRFGKKVRTVEREGVDLVVALDVSASMRAEDVAPNRLRRAKNEIRDLVGQLSGDRVGLVVFAGDGFVQCPLTTDYEAFRTFLDVASPNQVSVPGTDMGAAFDSAIQAFNAARPKSDSAALSGEPRPRALLLVSDGENHIGEVSTMRETAREANMTVLTSGVGTEKGARVPEYENGEHVGFKRNGQGGVVTSRLQQDVLTRLAESGAYFRIGSATSALSDVPAALRQVGSSSFGEQEFSDYEEKYQWPLAAGLLLLYIEALIPVRARTRRNRPLAVRLGLAQKS